MSNIWIIHPELHDRSMEPTREDIVLGDWFYANTLGESYTSLMLRANGVLLEAGSIPKVYPSIESFVVQRLVSVVITEKPKEVFWKSKSFEIDADKLSEGYYRAIIDGKEILCARAGNRIIDIRNPKNVWESYREIHLIHPVDLSFHTETK